MPRYIIADPDAKGGSGWSHIFEVFEPGLGVVHVERDVATTMQTRQDVRRAGGVIDG